MSTYKTQVVTSMGGPLDYDQPIENENGNFVNTYCGEPVTAFEKNNGRWGLVHEGLFSTETYDDADDAFSAFEFGSVCWVDPFEWKQAKHGGYYRQSRLGTISVKKAKSGKWFWTAMRCEGVHGWFSTREEAQHSADRYEATGEL